MIEVRRIKSISAHASAGMTDRKGSSPKMRFCAKTFLATGRISPLLSPFFGGVLSQLFVIGQKRVAVYTALFCLMTARRRLHDLCHFYLNTIFGGYIL